MTDSGAEAKREEREASEKSDKKDGVLDLRTAHGAELAAEDVPPRRVDALWPETAVTPPKSGDAVADAEKKES